MDTNKNETQKPKGLPLHSKAPKIDSIDIYFNPIKLEDLLKIYNGVLVDFFRGSW
ncbi:MAG: hypothetical protein ACFFDF_22775 [Candidatus Odinarchaeota archaeon]